MINNINQEKKMWIKQLPKNYYELPSFCYDSVMLWQNKRVYVMDNHLSAAWCWLQSCDSMKKYNFMHIDRHYDMLECFLNEDLQPLCDNPNMSYTEFKNLKRIRGGNNYVFRWDNYIMATYTIRPDWFHTNIFLTHQEGTIGSSWGHQHFDINKKNPLSMDYIINQYIGQPSENPSCFKDDNYKLLWIVNLDLDVFYTIHDPHVQLFSNEYIRFVSKLLNKNMHNIQVLTIALSPDCMGGEEMEDKWDNAFRVLTIMSEELECLREFPFPRHIK